MLFTPSAPYDFSLTVTAARFYSVLGVANGEGDEMVYRRVLRVPMPDKVKSTRMLIELQSIGTVDQPQIKARILTASGDFHPDDARAAVARMLNPGIDLAPFYVAAARHPVMAETIRALRGMSAFAMDSVFESLALTMIEQQITLKGAQAGERWLIQTYGDALEYEGKKYYAFPTSARLAGLIDEDLRALKITFVRINRILAIARAASREIDLEGLRSNPDAKALDAAYAALRTMKGVGHWTASWAMIRAFGHFLNFGSADVALRAAVNFYIFEQPGRCNPEVLDTFFAPLAPYDGWAAFYLIMRWALDRYTTI